MLNKPLTPLKLVPGMPILHFIAQYEPCKQPSRSHNPLHIQLVFTVKLDLKYYNFFKNLASTLAFNSKKALKIKRFCILKKSSIPVENQKTKKETSNEISFFVVRSTGIEPRSEISNPFTLKAFRHFVPEKSPK